MKCTLCPRECGADREKGEIGYCGADGTIRVSRAAPHYWEEPCISGENGSGAVFFGGCSLHCVYCQNREISRRALGRAVTADELADVFISLQSQGVHNINLVTPTHYSFGILQALKKARLNIPVVYNCGGYEKVDALRALDGEIQIYLPDFKYSDTDTAALYSHAPDYPSVALCAIDEMVRQRGAPVFDGDGMMKSGVLVRHLVLPGRADESMRAIRTLHERFGDGIYISIMKQYTPMPDLPFDELRRPVSDDEYELVTDYAAHIGVKNGFTQTGESVGESFIPKFDI